MKLITVVGIFLLSSTIVMADEGSKILLDGSSLCSSPNNPLVDGVKALGGSYYSDVLESNGVVTASVISDPAIYNTAIMAPARVVGSVQFQMTHERPLGRAPGLILKCSLIAKKI